MILDQAFDAKGQFTIRAPVRFIRDQILDTEWKKNYAWRPFLDPLIIGLGDQQLVTGYAVLLSGWIKVRLPHSSSCYDSPAPPRSSKTPSRSKAPTSSSHLAALITLRKYFRRYRLIAKIRLTLVVVFACFLLASMIAAIGMPELVHTAPEGGSEKQSRAQRLSFLVPMFFIIVGFSTALVCIMATPRRKLTSPRGTIWNQDGRGTHMHPRLERSSSIAGPANFGLILFYVLFLNPLIAFIIQLILALLSTILVLSQKFSVPDERGKWCGLQDQGENEWGFGQTLSVVMLLLPAMSAAQAYLEGRQHIRERERP